MVLMMSNFVMVTKSRELIMFCSLCATIKRRVFQNLRGTFYMDKVLWVYQIWFQTERETITGEQGLLGNYHTINMTYIFRGTL